MSDPYLRQSRPEYATRAANGMTASLLPSADAPTELLIVGPCPQCSDQMAFRHPLFVIKGIEEMTQERAKWMWEEVKRQAGGEREALREITVYCRCEVVHEQGKEGCGAYWKLEAAW